MTGLSIKLIVAVAPAIVLAILMIRRDKMNPEPIGWLLAATGLGILSGIGAIILGLSFPQIEVDGYASATLSAFINAAIPEELLKLSMLSIIAKKCKAFDEYFDGIVYAVCIGLGVAGLENILYLLVSYEWMVTGISRALLSVPAHYFFAIIMGTFFSLAFFDKKNEKVYMIMALVLPIIVHGLYDTFCFSMAISEETAGYILLTFFVSFHWLRKFSKQLVQSLLKLDSYGYPTR